MTVEAGRRALACALWLLAAAALAQTSAPSRLLHGFGAGLEGWRIPAWSLRQASYVGERVTHAQAGVGDQPGSLELSVAFDGDRWQRALVAVERPLDLRGYGSLSFSAWLPAHAPQRLAATVFVLLGEDGEGVESREAVRLTPGEWTRAEVSLVPGEDGWRAPFDRAKVRGLMLAVEKDQTHRGKPLLWRGVVRFDEVSLHPPATPE